MISAHIGPPVHRCFCDLWYCVEPWYCLWNYDTVCGTIIIIHTFTIVKPVTFLKYHPVIHHQMGSFGTRWGTIQADIMFSLSLHITRAQLLLEKITQRVRSQQQSLWITLSQCTSCMFFLPSLLLIVDTHGINHQPLIHSHHLGPRKQDLD